MSNLRYFYAIVILTFGGLVYAHADGNILKNPNGSVRYMTHVEALTACPAGTHLPTARELAQESQKKGSKGIWETDQGAKPVGFYKIEALNSDGYYDKFSFSHEGYVSSPSDLESNFFWSSTVDAERPYNAYYLRGDSGMLSTLYRYHGRNIAWRVAVRCFSSH